ncbi:helix-turn-helix transcriptional regulator [Trinickia violacea]|uniref:Helix-turn-helix transcriptional regulator n=1 Tax=Trinickia violacea TaxID=2571746 RepID=A0A4P8IVQ6_9BURK|nr:helix-turn-helix transcriptional regulator [Trinickia violacea]QCP52506.1 helix-turn-helix transcriptional regulator [Trinickia violacea]
MCESNYADVQRESRKMAQARDYLDAHYREDVSIDALAALVGLSRFHLMRASACAPSRQ